MRKIYKPVAGTVSALRSEHVFVATLSAAPTSSTISYTVGSGQDAVTRDFKVGDEVRVLDGENGGDEKNGYVFYKLYDLVTEGDTTTAYWQKNDGSPLPSNMKPEKLTIRLVPPSGSSSSVLNGVPIGVCTYVNSERFNLYTGVWDGTDIKLEIGTTWPFEVYIDGNFSKRYLPVFPESDHVYVNENGIGSIYLLPLFNNERVLEIEYIDIETAIATIYIDDTINDPEAKITRSQTDVAIMSAIKKRFHRYLGKYDNGVLKMCQLDDYYSYYFHDRETQATTQGPLGDVFVTCESPIYTRYSVDTSLGHNRHKIEISLANGGNGWKEWHFGFGQDRDVLGAYNATEIPIVEEPSKPVDLTEWRPASVSNVQPSLALYSHWAALFQNNNPFRMVSWGEHNIIAVLLYAMYGTTNSYNAIGYAVGENSSHPSQTGVYTDNQGVGDTSGQNNWQSTNFLGLENWVGNVCEFIGNARCNVSQIDGVIRVTERDGSTRSIPFPDPTYVDIDDETGETYTHYSSCVFPKMQFGQNLDVVAATDAVDYDTNTYDGDAYNDIQSTGKGVSTEFEQYITNAILVRSGSFNSPDSQGINFFGFMPSIDIDSDNPLYTPVGTRMCFTGTTQLIADPADYLALFENE